MKKINRVLLIALIIITICIIAIIIVLMKLSEHAVLHEKDAIPQDNDAIIQDEQVSELDGISEYFNVKYCLQLYYTAISNLKYSVSENEVGLGIAQSRC